MENNEINKKALEEIYEKGYQGVGMCSHCWNSTDSVKGSGSAALYCTRYQSWCKSVARNCPGIEELKVKPA